MPLGEGRPHERRSEREANTSLSRRLGVSVTLQSSQDGATQLTRYG